MDRVRREYICATLDGQKMDASEGIIPILKISNGQLKLIGTGFFISLYGHFVTAKHVLMDALDESRRQKNPVHILQFPPEGFLPRDVIRFSFNENYDVAIGEIEPHVHSATNQPVLNRVPILTAEVPEIGSNVVTCAYPETVIDTSSSGMIFKAFYYDGTLEEHHLVARDSVMLPFPCYRTSIPLLGGASGGPVFDSKGRVFGVNCSGFGNDPPVSYISRGLEILELEIHDVKLAPELEPRTYSVRDLARLGHISFQPPLM